MINLTNQEKIEYIGYKIDFLKSALDLEKADLINLIEINSPKVEEVRTDILNKQLGINSLEDALKALTGI